MTRAIQTFDMLLDGIGKLPLVGGRKAHKFLAGHLIAFVLDQVPSRSRSKNDSINLLGFAANGHAHFRTSLYPGFAARCHSGINSGAVSETEQRSRLLSSSMRRLRLCSFQPEWAV